MYTQILELTEEIETVIGTDDHARLQHLMARRAEAFAAMAEQGLQASSGAIVIIEKIQECEKRCEKQAILKIEEIRKNMDEIRKGKRLEKAYGQFVHNG